MRTCVKHNTSYLFFLWEQYKMSFLGEQEIIRAKTIFMLSLRFIFINLCDDDDDDEQPATKPVTLHIILTASILIISFKTRLKLILYITKCFRDKSINIK